MASSHDSLCCSESWAPGVQKLAAYSQDGTFLGTVFLDLYKRTAKYTGAAQFTISCGKQLRNGTYRRPVVALCFNFDGPNTKLPFDQVHMRAAAWFYALATGCEIVMQGSR